VSPNEHADRYLSLIVNPLPLIAVSPNEPVNGFLSLTLNQLPLNAGDIG
jgi:hypothetical protein